MDIYQKASRLKLRYDSPQGKLSVEDLWDLPLTSTRTNTANLDGLAVELDQQLQNSGTTKSFVTKTTKANDLLKLKFDIILNVIETKMKENAEAEERKASAEKKQRILSLIADKEDQALSSKSLEELKAMVGAL